MDLFSNHPEYPEKVRDVIDISIIRNKLNSKYFELQIKKADDTTDNISYRYCDNNSYRYWLIIFLIDIGSHTKN